jgi:hypothetical protein
VTQGKKSHVGAYRQIRLSSILPLKPIYIVDLLVVGSLTKHTIDSPISAQKENLMADLPADVDQLRDHLASVLHLNAGLQNQVHRLELHIQQM